MAFDLGTIIGTLQSLLSGVISAASKLAGLSDRLTGGSIASALGTPLTAILVLAVLAAVALVFGKLVSGMAKLALIVLAVALVLLLATGML